MIDITDRFWIHVDGKLVPLVAELHIDKVAPLRGWVIAVERVGTELKKRKHEGRIQLFIKE